MSQMVLYASRTIIQRSRRPMVRRRLVMTSATLQDICNTIGLRSGHAGSVQAILLA